MDLHRNGKSGLPDVLFPTEDEKSSENETRAKPHSAECDLAHVILTKQLCNMPVSPLNLVWGGGGLGKVNLSTSKKN